MAKNNKNYVSSTENKKTKQGAGRFTKTPNSAGETFHHGKRAGSPPSKARQRKKPSRGQGR